jgi:CheY-like chemotaxis protein
MDIQMPKMDGLHATKAIRSHERDSSRHTPIIALTAHAMEGDRERFVKAGMDSYVAKPLNSRQLYATIEDCVKNNSSLEPMRDPCSASSSQDTILNIEELLLAFDNDAHFVEELITTYLRQSSPEILSKIHQAVEINNPESLEMAAHRLKGASAVIGAKQVYIVATQLEEMGNQQKLADVHETVRSLEQRLDALEKYVEKNIGRYLPHSPQ